MVLPLHDGSLVGDGSQIGMFPVLADQPLDKPARLLRSAANPRMDLVLLVVQDAAAAASASSAPAPPPGMSAAQFALVQRMLAARQRGANAPAAQGALEPKRGPQLNLVLWRMGDDSSIVWSSPLSFDKIMDPPVGSRAAPQQEHEDALLHDVAWSPTGDRLALLVSITRSPVASSSAAEPRRATFLRTYSVQDGRLLSTVRLNSAGGGAMSMQWLETDFAADRDAVDGSAEALIAKLPPLPQLPPADTFASAGASGNLMPHQLRMMQMSGQKPPPSFQYPSQLAVQGRGPLATIPSLAKAEKELGLLEGADGSLALSSQIALPLTPQTVVVVAQPQSALVQLVLDAQTCIGALSLPQSSDRPTSQASACQSQLLLPSRDLSQLVALSTDSDSGSHAAAVSQVQLRLPLPSATRYAPSCTRHRLVAFSRASHLVRFHLGYALDTASALQQIYQKEYVAKVTSEWTRNLDDIGSKFGGDMRYELVNVLLTGRAGPAAEQFLLGNLTEGVLSRLEQHAHAAMYALKKHIAESLRPSLERAIVSVEGIRGLVRFFDFALQHPLAQQTLSEVLRVLQTVLASSLALADEVDREALVSQEFYRWCRTERERQERIKQDQDEPRLPIVYDVHTVASYIDRGFDNSAIARALATEATPDARKQDAPKRETKVSLADSLKQAESFLADPRRASNKIVADQSHESAAAILPSLTLAIAMLGEQLVQLLDAGLERSELLQSQSQNAAGRGCKLIVEEAPARSLSSTTNERSPADRVQVASFVSNESMLAAFIVASGAASERGSSILVVRHDVGADGPGIETAHFALAHAPHDRSEITIVDVGFYGDTDLLVLATFEDTSSSVLLAFALPQLPFNQIADEPRPIAPARATEFEPGFRASSIAVNKSKQTVALAAEDGSRIVYLDIAAVEPFDSSMYEER